MFLAHGWTRMNTDSFFEHELRIFLAHGSFFILPQILTDGHGFTVRME